MARIAYRPETLTEPHDIVAPIRARRGGALTLLDRMLLHSPGYAQGWNDLLRQVRQELRLDPKLRETAIVAIAALNEAPFEHQQHAPEYLKAGGTPAQLEMLTRPYAALNDESLFDPAERAVLRLTLEMTRTVRVDDATFTAAAVALGNDQDLVELIGVIATYNMVSRFLVALGVVPEDEVT